MPPRPGAVAIAAIVSAGSIARAVPGANRAGGQRYLEARP
jgi:hypothetical protein